MGDMSTNGEGSVNEPRWLTPAEDRAWRAYRRMRALLDLRLARDLARDVGLSEADYDVLSTLTEVEGHRWRLTALARRLLWTKSRLSHQVARMEQRGLVRREEIEGDRRAAIVALSDEGLRVLQEAAPGHVQSVREHFIDLLDEQEVEALAALAQRVVAHLGEEASDTR